MKKILLSIISLTVCAVLFVGCSSQVSILIIKAKWYDNLAIENVMPISEELIYDITFEPKSNTAITVKDFVGTYKTQLNADSENQLYTLTSELSTSGAYQAESQDDIPFNDLITTEVIFKGLKNNLKPVSSSKNYDAVSYFPFGSQLSERFKRYEYSYEIDYSGSKASVVYENSQSLESASKKQEYTKIDKKHTFFDNDQLIFVIRGLDLNDKFTQTFSTINVLESQLQSVLISCTVASKSDTPYSQITLKDLDLNGETSDVTLSVIKVNVALNASMSGSSFTLFYAAEKDKESSFNSRLIKMEQNFPGNLGTLIYTLKTVTVSYN